MDVETLIAEATYCRQELRWNENEKDERRLLHILSRAQLALERMSAFIREEHARRVEAETQLEKTKALDACMAGRAHVRERFGNRVANRS